MINIYTDGSYSDKIKLGAYAFIILGHENEFIYGEAGRMTDPKWLKSWNIGPELMACLKGLTKFNEIKDEKNLGDYVQVCHDYEGVAKWANHSWRAKLDYSKSYVNKIENFKSESKLNISFKKVKGHSGVKFNELVDKYTRVALKSGSDEPVRIIVN